MYIYLSDCQKANDVFTVDSEFRKYSKVWERVLVICDKLVNSSREVKLVKIPGHSDITGDDIADQKGKGAANEIKRGLKAASSEILVLLKMLYSSLSPDVI